MAGKLQKLGEHKPLTALPASNFARESSDYTVDDEPVGRVGYLKEAYPAAGPALASTDVRNTVTSRGSLGNDGTARGSYEITPQIIDAEDPEPGGHEGPGTGNAGAKNK